MGRTAGWGARRWGEDGAAWASLLTWPYIAATTLLHKFII